MKQAFGRQLKFFPSRSVAAFLEQMEDPPRSVFQPSAC